MEDLPKREEISRSVDQLIADLRTLGLHERADAMEAQRRALRQAPDISDDPQPENGDGQQAPQRSSPP
jgi:hypothetical protein